MSLYDEIVFKASEFRIDEDASMRGLSGSVVDFINLGISPVRTGIFNVADVAITVGALILLSAALRRQSTE